MRYTRGWMVFHIETNTVVMGLLRAYTRVWAYCWVLAGVLKYRKCWGNEAKWNRAKHIIDRAIQMRVCRGRRLDSNKERRILLKVVEMAERSGKPQREVGDILEESPWLMDMPLQATRRLQWRYA